MVKYPDKPVVAVGAVIIWNGRVLLVKRGSEPGKGKFAIPGGCLELGENLEEGLKREVKEEVGIDVKIGDLAGVYEWIEKDEKGRIKYHYVMIDYFAYPLSLDVKVGSDAVDALWVSPKDVAKLPVTKTTVKLLRDIGFLK